MIPEASFTFVTNGLTVIFKDTSLNAPTSWAWVFGDGNSSNVQNPTHTYAANGDYLVSLVASNADGDSEAYEYELTVNEENSIDIDTIIQFELPSSITLEQNHKNYLLSKWRLYLQAAFDIEDAYLMDQAHYSQMENILIAKLVIYDAILNEAKKYLASSMNGGGSSSSGAQGGNIKKIETGPSNVEWYSASDVLSKMFAPNKNGLSTFDQIMADICGIASKLKVKLPMCKLVGGLKVPIKTDTIQYLTSHHYMTDNYGN